MLIDLENAVNAYIVDEFVLPGKPVDTDVLQMHAALMARQLTPSQAGLLISIAYQSDFVCLVEDKHTYELFKPALTVEELWCISDGEYQEKIVVDREWAPTKIKDICTMLRECRGSDMEGWLADCIEFSEEE